MWNLIPACLSFMSVCLIRTKNMLKYGKLYSFDYNGSCRHQVLMRIKPYFGVPRLDFQVPNLKI